MRESDFFPPVFPVLVFLLPIPIACLFDTEKPLLDMDLQGALQQLQIHVRTQVEIVLTNLAGVATREHFDEALYNRFMAARQSIPVIYGKMLDWSNQLNNLSFAQGLQTLAETLNTITLEVDAALQQGVDEARKQRFIQGVTNADAVMSAFLQQVRFSSFPHRFPCLLQFLRFSCIFCPIERNIYIERTVF